MTLTVHHLQHSQSERIVWLCEELEIDYEIQRYPRRDDNRMAPPQYKALHPIGSAPVITDGDRTIAESAAIVEYIIATRGNGRLAVTPTDPQFPDYLYWFHAANGTLQPAIMMRWMLERVAPDSAPAHAANARAERILALLDERLSTTPYLAGPNLTAADIMTNFSLTTMRRFAPFELAPNLASYVERIAARPAYQRATDRARGS